MNMQKSSFGIRFAPRRHTHPTGLSAVRSGLPRTAQPKPPTPWDLQLPTPSLPLTHTGPLKMSPSLPCTLSINPLRASEHHSSLPPCLPLPLSLPHSLILSLRPFVPPSLHLSVRPSFSPSVPSLPPSLPRTPTGPLGPLSLPHRPDISSIAAPSHQRV